MKVSCYLQGHKVPKKACISVLPLRFQDIVTSTLTKCKVSEVAIHYDALGESLFMSFHRRKTPPAYIYVWDDGTIELSLDDTGDVKYSSAEEVIDALRRGLEK